MGGGLSSLSIAMAKGVGWRCSCYIVAGYGFLLALLVRLTVREPPRKPAQSQTETNTEEDEDFTVMQR